MQNIHESAVDLFTPDEHAVLAGWFAVEAYGYTKDTRAEQAVKRLGFVEEPNHYRLVDAALTAVGRSSF